MCRKDSNVEINDEVNRLIDLLEKQTNTNKQVPTKVWIVGYRCTIYLRMRNGKQLYFYLTVTTLRSDICYRKSACLSSVCNVRAPYAAG